jgi:hypothetical protein
VYAVLKQFWLLAYTEILPIGKYFITAGFCHSVLGTGGRIILKLILKKQHGSAWTGLIWLRTVTSGRLLSTQ